MIVISSAPLTRGPDAERANMAVRVVVVRNTAGSSGYWFADQRVAWEAESEEMRLPAFSVRSITRPIVIGADQERGCGDPADAATSRGVSANWPSNRE